MSLGFEEGSTRSGLDSAVFAKPPLRSGQFVAATFLVILLGVVDSIATVRLFEKISIFAILWMMLVFVTVFGTWLRSFAAHKKLSELYVSRTSDGKSLDFSLDLALRTASGLIYWGTSGAAATGIAGISAIIFIHTH